VQVVFYVGVQLDITLKEPQESRQPSAMEPELSHLATSSNQPTSNLEGGGAQGQLIGETESLLASLQVLSKAAGLAEGKGVGVEEEAEGDGIPLAKETVGPREKQLQRSVVGTVSFLVKVCFQGYPGAIRASHQKFDRALKCSFVGLQLGKFRKEGGLYPAHYKPS
jgi:hypothetical protein